jgi:hypothetical protein
LLYYRLSEHQNWKSWCVANPDLAEYIEKQVVAEDRWQGTRKANKVLRDVGKIFFDLPDCPETLDVGKQGLGDYYKTTAPFIDAKDQLPKPKEKKSAKKRSGKKTAKNSKDESDMKIDS